MAAASLDIMNDVLQKFGHMVGPEQAQLKDILLQGLVDPKPIIRKCAVSSLGESPLIDLPDSMPMKGFTSSPSHSWSWIGVLH